MQPFWVKPNTNQEKAFKHAMKKCGLNDKQATLALTVAFKSFRDALNMHSLPDEIDLELFKFKLSRFKIFLRMVKYGIWLRRHVINKLYYIFLMLPLRIRFESILRRKTLSLVQKKDDYLFLKNKYNDIMAEWLNDIKQYGENNNMQMHMTNDRISTADAYEEFCAYKKLLTTRRKRIYQDLKNKENG